MARKRYTAEQIIGTRREAEVALARGENVGKVARRLGVAEQTDSRWRRESGGLRVDQAKRLKELERENVRLKKPAALDRIQGILARGRGPGSGSRDGAPDGGLTDLPPDPRRGWVAGDVPVLDATASK